VTASTSSDPSSPLDTVRENSALVGGLGLVVSSVPLVLTYGFQSFGLVGLILAAFGALVSIGAYRYDTV